MTNQITPHGTDGQKVAALFGRALDGNDEAMKRLHELVFVSQARPDDPAVRRATSALRALGGPTRDGARPADAADLADSPWIVAYVDQLLAAARR